MKAPLTASFGTVLALAGCTAGFEADTVGIDKSFDASRDGGHLSNLVAGVWIDPNGCDHWIIDDGIEGYLSSRLDPSGKPVCSGHGAETVASGPFIKDFWFNRWSERSTWWEGRNQGQR